MRFAAWLSVIALALVTALTSRAVGAGQDPEVPAFVPAQSEGPPRLARPTGLLIDGPVDWESLRKRLSRPDLVILEGSQYRELVDRLRPAPQQETPPTFSVEALTVEGGLEGDDARLRLEITARCNSAPTWLPLRLDGLIPAEVTEGGRPLPLRRAQEQGGWEAELARPGRHQIAVVLTAPVHTDSEGQRLEFAIPTAASNRFALDVPARSIDAWAGAREPLSVTPLDDPPTASRILGNLPPRDLLSIGWKNKADSQDSGPPVLSAQGEIALDVDRGLFFARSVWAVRCDRGQARSLQFRMEETSEEILSVAIDGKPIPVEGLRDTRSHLVTIPLDPPLEPGTKDPRRLTIDTRRTLPAGTTTRLNFNGYPLVGGLAQSGVISIVQGSDLWVSATSGRGLRQIDPASELPESLRVRPRTVLAYQFVELPFELELRVDPSPPASFVEARTTLLLEPDSLRNQTDLAYRVTRGRIFDLRVGLPPGLELLEVGPPERVASYKVLDVPGPDARLPGRVVQVRLTTLAAEEGRFVVQLKARQAIAPRREVQAVFFQPIDVALGGGVIAVLAARSVAVNPGELAAEAADGTPFVPLLNGAPADWTWPEPRQPGLPSLWLRYEGHAEPLALRPTVRPREIHRETRLVATLERRRVDLIQTTDFHVRNGGFATIDIAVPPTLEAQPGRWGIEGGDVVSRTVIGTESDGSVRYRLALATEVVDSFSLSLWARLPLDPPLSHEKPRQIPLARIAILEGVNAGPLVVEVRADSAYGLEPSASGWTRSDGIDSGGARDGSLSAQWSWTGPESGSGPPPIAARAPLAATLPDLIASRLWLRTLQEPDGALLTEASFRLDSHEGAIHFALPAGAQPLRSHIGNEPVELELLDGSQGYRIRFPRETPVPLVLGIAYRTPPASTAGSAPPRLLGGGLVQETLWEYRVPWTQALVGSPAGWSDANTWYWDRYVFKRRPIFSLHELTSWVAGAKVDPKALIQRREDERLGFHGYLFSRAGPPDGFFPIVHSRASLVGVCSGAVLGIGMLLILLRPPGILVGVGMALLALTLGIAVEPSMFLVLLQSASVGLLLTFLAAITQRLVDRTAPRVPLGLDQNSTQLRNPSLRREPTHTLSPQPAGGEEGSTVIRRSPTVPATTLDYMPTPQQQVVREPSNP